MLTLLMMFLAGADAFSCSSDFDCSLNGVCDDSTGRCVCDSMWEGDVCDVMALEPANAAQKGAIYGFDPNVTSWGGNMVFIDDEYHLFVTEIAYGCHLDEWGRDSTVVRATSSSPSGPFKKQETVLLPEAHNPQIIILADGTFALFHIGAGDNSSYAPCNSKSQQAPLGGSVVHLSSSVYGPWTSHEVNIACNNPAPYQHSNGTLYLVCSDRGFHLYRSEQPQGPWSLIKLLPPSPPGMGTWEDPFLYTDNRQNWHILAHSWNHSDDAAISGHYFSPDGIEWHASLTQPFGNEATLTDGTIVKMRTRERPKLVFNTTTNTPTHLISGINTNPYCPSPASRCKVLPGYDWDYTFIQPIRQM